jgi:hypothetical protein
VAGAADDLNLGRTLVDREALMELILSGPVRVRMNSGDEYDIPNSEFAVVNDLHAVVLIRQPDGRLKTKILSLVCMVSAEPYEPADQSG